MTTTIDLTDYDAKRLRDMPYKEFLATAYWKSVAAVVKERDGRKCVVCNSPKKIAAHHRTYRHHGEEHLHLSDLTTLCEECHQRHHFPPEPAKVVVKTVVEYVRRPEPTFEPQPLTLWSLLSKPEKRFYRRAAMDLGRKAKNLAKLGRDEVNRMLAMKHAPKPEPAPIIGQNSSPVLLDYPRYKGCIVMGDISSVEADMPAGEEIVLTREILNKCRANGSFTTATVRGFGISRKDMTRGWAERLEGQTVSRETLLTAMRGRHLYSTKTFKIQRKIERARMAESINGTA